MGKVLVRNVIDSYTLFVLDNCTCTCCNVRDFGDWVNKFLPNSSVDKSLHCN